MTRMVDQHPRALFLWNILINQVIKPITKDWDLSWTSVTDIPLIIKRPLIRRQLRIQQLPRPVLPIDRLPQALLVHVIAVLDHCVQEELGGVEVPERLRNEVISFTYSRETHQNVIE